MNRIPKIKHNKAKQSRKERFLEIIYSLLHEILNGMLSFKYDSKAEHHEGTTAPKNSRNSRTIPKSVKYQINFRFL